MYTDLLERPVDEVIGVRQSLNNIIVPIVFEAKQKGHYFIEQLQATLSSNIPSITKQEYCIDKKIINKKYEKNKKYINMNITKKKNIRTTK